MSAEETLVGRLVLGRYRIVMPIARGGQGMVYLARGEGAAGFARPVVVKRVLPGLAGDARIVDAFAREARITSQLRHPGIVSVLDFERDGDSYVMVLEYVRGYDLRRWWRFVAHRRGRFAADLAGHALLCVLEALHHAHTLRAPDGSPRRVVHRDVSPANVLIDQDGPVKLTDFGIARMDAEEVTVVTSGLQIKGKLPYVAPEMYRGAEPSAGTDLYACAVMLHELLLNRNEFRANGALEIMRLTTEHRPTRPDTVRRDVSRGYADVVMRALEKDPAARFASALEFADALGAALGGDYSEREARFRASVRADFGDRDFPRLVDGPSLADLDRAFAAAASSAPTRPSLTPARSPTAPLARASAAPLPPVLAPAPRAPAPSGGHVREGRARGSSRVLSALTFALAALVLLAAWFAWPHAGRETPRFVFVERERAAAPAVASEPARLPEVDIVTRAPDVPPPAPRDPSRAERLSAAFARRRSEVERCFAAHREDVGPRLDVQVEFAIDAGGRVMRARMVPDELTTTAFGTCVTRVALGTDFGAQPARVVVRIPITARVVR